MPIPLPPIGRVESGLLTLSNEKITEAKRIALPNPFRSAVSISNLKRALLETRFPIEGTDKELVVFNLRLEAYDNGEGKIAQSKKLADVLSQEYAKGNYVIAGGDFNQVFKGSHRYPDLGEAEAGRQEKLILQTYLNIFHLLMMINNRLCGCLISLTLALMKHPKCM